MFAKDAIASGNSETNKYQHENRLITIPCRDIALLESKVFTYPTRLAGAWEAQIVQLIMKSQHSQGCNLKVMSRFSSNHSDGIDLYSRRAKFLKRFTAPLQVTNGYVFDARYDTECNIAHILVNVAARVLPIRESFPELKVVLRTKATSMAKEVYRLLQIPIICTDGAVFGAQVFVVEPALIHGLEGLYKSIFGSRDFEGYNVSTPDRVFISRKGSRCLINEQEIEAILKEYGFVKVYFEDLPVCEQWSISRNARVVVGLHGAALSSLVFNRNQVKLVELFHPGYFVDMYRKLVAAIDGTWCGVTGQITKDVIGKLDFQHQARSFALKSTRIDPASLRMALEYMDISKQ